LKLEGLSNYSPEPGSSRAGEEEVLDVENWAEIRRLYRAEGLPIREIRRVIRRGEPVTFQAVQREAGE
jgi:hypothetical protein